MVCRSCCNVSFHLHLLGLYILKCRHIPSAFVRVLLFCISFIQAMDDVTDLSNTARRISLSRLIASVFSLPIIDRSIGHHYPQMLISVQYGETDYHGPCFAKTHHWAYAGSETQDQPMHSHNLSSAFAVR